MIPKLLQTLRLLRRKGETRIMVKIPVRALAPLVAATTVQMILPAPRGALLRLLVVFHQFIRVCKTYYPLGFNSFIYFHPSL